MRIEGKWAVLLVPLFLAGCAYQRPPVVYTTPEGQVISAGPDARTAADRALETSLRAEVNQYGDLASANPDLQFYANNGTVTLTGSVRNEQDRQMIDTLTRNTRGVASVNDQLQVVYPPTGTVRPPLYPTPAPVYPPVVVGPGPGPRIDAVRPGDEPLAHKIGEQLRMEAVPADWLQNVRIQVNNGAVYLQGYVDHQHERERIDSTVQHTRGVVAVYDQLQVR